MRRRDEFEQLEDFVIYLSEILMSLQDQVTQLTAAQATLTADFGSFVTAVQTEVSSLQTQLQNALETDGGIDLTAAIASANNLDAAAKAAQAALPAPVAPTAPAAPTTPST